MSDKVLDEFKRLGMNKTKSMDMHFGNAKFLDRINDLNYELAWCYFMLQENTQMPDCDSLGQGIKLINDFLKERETKGW